MKIYNDEKYKFTELFSSETGFYIRTEVLDSEGKQTGVEPFMRSFPSLLDIGIMGTCSSVQDCHVGCYQQGAGNKVGKNMDIMTFKRIIRQASGRTFEVALGGFGNPNEHPNFKEIVSYARQNDIVPNYTTSGINLTKPQIHWTKKYCGAVAVSEHNMPYTRNAIRAFVEAGVKTNIHYVLGKDTIDKAIAKLESNGFDEGINAVIFLLYKPVGKKKRDNVLSVTDERVKRFYELIDYAHPFKCGLDACHVPGVTNFSKNVAKESISGCDGARFSMYISHDGYAMPCSFDVTTRKWAVSLEDATIDEVWNGEVFSRFREYHNNSCPSCELRSDCRGGCPLMGDKINLCEKEEREYHEN